MLIKLRSTKLYNGRLHYDVNVVNFVFASIAKDYMISCAVKQLEYYPQGHVVLTSASARNLYLKDLRGRVVYLEKNSEVVIWPEIRPLRPL